MPHASRLSRSVSLPVLPAAGRVAPAGPAVRRRSSISRWRAGVLIAIQLLMVAHVLHWWITGKSVGRFVLSDSMNTLEIGEINPGFLLFAGALLVTAVFGRFMCGWVCHMGALQDFCAWLLRRAGLRPRLFRSRLLGYVPLALAFYMFLWPTFRREVLQGSLRLVWPEAAATLQTPAFPGVSAAFTTDDLWQGLPTWEIAVPFLALCGFGTVYFLGARGLCRYGCPYGGFLLPIEQLAFGRVVVDMSKCDQCGLCTAACTTGVRVHDEVRLFGSVTDRNCVRSFDCVGACPHHALKFSFTRPPLLHRGGADRPLATRYDLPLAEELLCLGVFVATFFVTRGLYNLVPMLLAATLGVLAAFLTWKAWRLVRDANVRLGRFQLRLRGNVRPAGWVFAGGVALLALLLVHSAAVRAILWTASGHDDLVRVPYEIAVTGRGVSEQDLAAAAKARRLFALARPIWRGGIALATTTPHEFRLAWILLVLGDKDAASNVLRGLLRNDQAASDAGTELARLLLSDHKHDEAIAVLQSVMKDHPRAASARDMLAMLWISSGDVPSAESLYQTVLERTPGDAAARTGLGRLLVITGRHDEGIASLRRAASEWPRNITTRRELARALYSIGRVDEAVTELRSAADSRPAARSELLALAEQMQRRSGR